jgi:Fe-S cluster assembly protein SufD
LAELATAPVDRATGAFHRDAVQFLAESAPAWLRERRLEAWDTYERTPMPTTKLEEWRYTDVKLLSLDKVHLVGFTPPALFGASVLSKDVGSAVIVDGTIVSLSLPEELRAKGVILKDLETAAHEHSDLVEQHLATRALPASAGKFSALNAALWTGGIFLYVPRGVNIERPIRITHKISHAGIAIFPRTLIIAEQGSSFGVVEEYLSEDFDSPALSCPVAEVFAGNAAHVQYVALQRWGRGVRHVAGQRTIAGRDANLDTLVVNLGGTVARVDLAAALEGPGARSDMLGLYFGSEDQHFDHNTRQDHKVPHATSDLLYKGALTDSSHSIFRGLIKVWPKAQRTDAYQTNRNLLLSNSSEATSLPNLEIEADDVRCSHASTVGHLDQEELFYIMSRGVPREQAERLVVFGFLGEVLDRLPMPDVVEELRQAIGLKLG